MLKGPGSIMFHQISFKPHPWPNGGWIVLGIDLGQSSGDFSGMWATGILLQDSFGESFGNLGIARAMTARSPQVLFQGPTCWMCLAARLIIGYSVCVCACFWGDWQVHTFSDLIRLIVRQSGFPCAGFRSGIFIETGTFLGQTVVALSLHFSELHTIELSTECFEAARLFAWKAARPIHYHLGNSIKVLKTILPKVSGPTVLYLDAHWSGSVTKGLEEEIPLMKELGF